MSTDTFLTTLVTSVIQTMQISDATTSMSPEDDPVIREMAKVSYRQITSYCYREFEKDEYLEEYHSVQRRIILRHTPVVSVSDVWVDDVALVVNVDYKVVRNKIILLKSFSDNLSSTDLFMMGQDYLGSERRARSLFTDVSLSRDKDVIVKYEGGYELSEDCPNLYSALLMQTIALYNRRSILGMASVAGKVGGEGQSTITGTSDTGNLLEVVQNIMSTFIYYGDVDNA